MELENQLRKVFSETFAVPEDKITPATQPSNLDEWDSLGQLRLIMNVESEFRISFHIDEIKDINSFEMLLKSIQEKKS
jgi:acyl carrier protein